jgi:hypothetical protein
MPKERKRDKREKEGEEMMAKEDGICRRVGTNSGENNTDTTGTGTFDGSWDVAGDSAVGAKAGF